MKSILYLVRDFSVWLFHVFTRHLYFDTPYIIGLLKYTARLKSKTEQHTKMSNEMYMYESFLRL